MAEVLFFIGQTKQTVSSTDPNQENHPLAHSFLDPLVHSRQKGCRSLSSSSPILRYSHISVSDAIYTRKLKFLTKLQSTEICLCKLFVKNTVDELATVRECIRAMNTCISS